MLFSFGEKLSLSKASRLPRKTKGMKRMDDPPVFSSRSAAKLELDEDSSSGKKPNTTKPKSFQFRSVGKLQLDKDSSSGKKPNMTKPKGNVKGFRFWPVEECLPKAKKRNRFEEAEPRGQVTWVTDASTLTEAMNNKVDMDEIFLGLSEGLKRGSTEFATAALSYLQEKGHKLELVKAGSYEGQVAGFGMRFHHNFKAKRADDPHAPVETYFAQLHEGPRLVVECCVSLGESDSLPYERDNQGCKYCTQFVHHPHGACDGIIWGRLVWGPGVNDCTVV